ncbi:MAG: carboxynorspermidine decarboxylase [Oscillospiraceae bacterium]|nr:carboxynorspermidine decarboxylase [Oscillospiraceae bacterium]
MNTPDFDITSLHTPCYVVDRRLIEKNMTVLDSVRRRTGAKILLAQKAFSMFSLYPDMSQYIDGTTASGLYEAMLGYEEMPGSQVHIYSPAYRDSEFDRIASICDHIIFNTPAQYRRFADRAKGVQCGIRVNPGYSEVETAIYDPCSPLSRLGTRAEDFDAKDCEGISGLHFHSMCEQGSDVLERTLPYFESSFGRYLESLEWVNFGGGHHITKPGYDTDRLCRLIDSFKERYGVEVYLEPGEAHALDAGFLVTEVLDVFTSGGNTHAIVDASAACHMPDVLEMPYRPPLYGSGEEGEKPYTCRIGAATCLAGDVIGTYSFDEPLRAGDRLVFGDMAIYTMCKNNTFNGIGLPWIYTADDEGTELVKKFGYEDFRMRLS